MRLKPFSRSQTVVEDIVRLLLHVVLLICICSYLIDSYLKYAGEKWARTLFKCCFTKNLLIL